PVILSAFIDVSRFLGPRLSYRPVLSSRLTTFVGSGSLPAASRKASCAVAFGTPSISNRILPGRINATPCPGAAFSFSHTSLSRFLGDRLVGEQANPNLAAALDEARHGDTGGFNLP